MTKNALLFYGHLPQNCKKYGSQYNQYYSYGHWKQFVLNENDNLDVFIHTWHASEDQIDNVKAIFDPKNIKNDVYVHDDAPRSSCLSMKIANDMCNEYAKTHDITYEKVMICRMDVVWFIPVCFDTMFDASKFTVSYWGSGKNDENANRDFNRPYDNSPYYGTHDIFFVSNKENMDVLCSIYDCLDKYEKDVTCFVRHTLLRWHMKQTHLESIVDFKIFINNDMEIESRIYMTNNQNLLNKLKYLS